MIEEKHGFNKLTLKLYITDQIKATLLTIIIGGPLIAILIKITQWGGPNFYIYAFAFLVVFTFLMMWVVPNFIMPLFNKYTDLPEGELKSKIEDLAKS